MDEFFNNEGFDNPPVNENEQHIPKEAPQYVTVPNTAPDNKPSVSKLTIILCIVCAVVGSIIGGIIVGTVTKKSIERDITDNTTAAITTEAPKTPMAEATTAKAEGNSVVSGTVTTNDDKPSEDKVFTAKEIYKNNVESVVSIVCKSYYGKSSGTGFIVSEDGYIVTNNHVVEGAQSVSVTLYDDTTYSATVVGTEETNDLAILKIEPKGEIHSLIYGRSSDLEVGDPIYIIGNPLGDLTFTLTNGVVSALNRLIDVQAGLSINMFQTNAAVNSGNSGGPAFDEHGYVIGIASAKYASAAIEGLSFCIPIDDVRSMIDEIINKGYVSGKPYIGISVYDREVSTYGFFQSTRSIAGAKILEVGANTPATKSGLQVGDIIVEASGKAVTSVSALRTILTEYRSGDIITFTVSRNGSKEKISVLLGEYEPSEPRTNYNYVYDL